MLVSIVPSGYVFFMRPSGYSLTRVPSGYRMSFCPLAYSIAFTPFFSILWIVPSVNMLSSSPSAKMHLMVPSGNLKDFSEEMKLGYLHDFLGAVVEMLLDLVVAEFEHLESVREGRLGRAGFCKVVHNLLVREGLLDVTIVEVDDSVAIREGLPLDSVAEDDFLFAVVVGPLNFPVISDDLVLDRGVFRPLIVILLWHFHLKVFLVLLINSILILVFLDSRVVVVVALVVNLASSVAQHLMHLVLLIFEFNQGLCLFKSLPFGFN